MSRLLLTIFLVFLTECFCSGEEAMHRVKLSNGDVITGIVLSDAEGVLRLEVEYLGVVSIPKERVSDMTKIESLVVVTKEVQPGTADQSEYDHDPSDIDRGEPELDVVSENRGAADGKITEVVVVKAPDPDEGVLKGFWKKVTSSADAWSPLPEWEKRLQFGLNSTSGRTEQSTHNYRFDMLREHEGSQMDIGGEYSYGDADGNTTSNKLSSRVRWRKDLSAGMFYESQSVYSWDKIKLIDSNVEQKFGIGTRFLDNDLSTVSAGLGASGRWRTFSDDTDEVVYLLDVFQDWDYRMTERVSLKQDFKFAMPVEDSDDYEMNFSAAVTSEVTDSINLSVRYEFGYDNSLEEALKADRRFVSSLGYSF